MTAYSVSQLVHAVSHLTSRKDYRPQCATCGKPVEKIDVSESLQVERGVQVAFVCHGAIERVILRSISDWPKRVLLGRWAEYRTTTKPERRRVLR